MSELLPSNLESSLRETLQELYLAAHPLMVAETQRTEPGSTLLNLLVRAKDLAPLDHAMRAAARVLGDPWPGDRQQVETADDDAELIERVLSLLDSGRCSYDGCVQGAYPSARDGSPVPCMWHDERGVVARLLRLRFPPKTEGPQS